MVSCGATEIVRQELSATVIDPDDHSGRASARPGDTMDSSDCGTLISWAPTSKTPAISSPSTPLKVYFARSIKHCPTNQSDVRNVTNETKTNSPSGWRPPMQRGATTRMESNPASNNCRSRRWQGLSWLVLFEGQVVGIPVLQHPGLTLRYRTNNGRTNAASILKTQSSS